jgi:DNA-binding IclR family transcriptional regulator
MRAKVSRKKKDSPYRVQVLDRVLGILETLSSEDSELTLVELCDHLGLHKSTVHRLLMVLEQYRFIEKTPQNGKYRLGLKLFELGSKAVAHLDIRERARPFLERLVFETGETAHMCILDHGEALCVEKVEASRTVRVPTTVGQRHPVHCTAVGKALIAFLTDEDIEYHIKGHGLRAYTRNTITTPAQLRNELRLVRERGYATDRGEVEDGLNCLGAPVRDYSGKVVAAISIAGPAFRLTDKIISVSAQLVVEAADQLSMELGYQDKPPKEIADHRAARSK